MKENLKESNQFIIFRIKNEQYCINSKFVSAMMPVPLCDPGDVNPHGSNRYFTHRNQVMEMISLRSILGIPTTDQEFEEFAQMIDTRKDDHIRWVKELEHSANTGEPFTLATDPHQCAFGKWYDNFKIDNYAVTFHLGKINTPHKELHHAALEVMECSQRCDTCARDECLKSIFGRVKEHSMPVILKLLDETKDIFRSVVYRNIILVINNASPIGLVVDEILSVESLIRADVKGSFHSIDTSSLIRDVKQKDAASELILEINVSKLF